MHQTQTFQPLLSASVLYWTMEEVPELVTKLSLVRQRLVEQTYVGAEFLPTGSWPVIQNSNGVKGKRHQPPTLDGTRFAFLDGLFPLARIVGFKAFYGKDSYCAYIVKAQSGERIALVDNPMTENALYVFKADMPKWGAVATLTKLDVLTGSYPEFVSRVLHQGDWQARVIDLLAIL